MKTHQETKECSFMRFDQLDLVPFWKSNLLTS